MDFTLTAYRKYISAIKSSYKNISTFDDFFLFDKEPTSFCIIRHDIDRRPKKALDFAKIESELDIKSSYFFRTKPHVFIPAIIKQISDLGHEIGYHYESLSDMKGDIKKATIDFRHNLEKLREIVKIKTVAMHGAPLSRFDNRDLWKKSDQKKRLKEEFEILGEIYLDIDYTDIAYITDTGRNWLSSSSNKRDRVNSSIHCNFKDGNELYHNLINAHYPKLIFQTHPERWASNFPEFFLIFLQDKTINIIKQLI